MEEFEVSSTACSILWVGIVIRRALGSRGRMRNLVIFTSSGSPFEHPINVLSGPGIRCFHPESYAVSIVTRQQRSSQESHSASIFHISKPTLLLVGFSGSELNLTRIPWPFE